MVLLSVHVYIALCGGASLCMLTLYACCCLQTTAHLCHSIYSLSFKFGVLLIVTSTTVLCPGLVESDGIPRNKYSSLHCQIIIKTQLDVIPVEMSIQADVAGASLVKVEGAYEM